MLTQDYPWKMTPAGFEKQQNEWKEVYEGAQQKLQEKLNSQQEVLRKGRDKDKRKTQSKQVHINRENLITGNC